MSQQKSPLSLRLSPELEAALEECAARLKIKKHTLAQMAIDAAVDAIVENDYRIVMPIKFDVSHIPVVNHKSRTSSTYPESSGAHILNEKPESKKKSA